MVVFRFNSFEELEAFLRDWKSNSEMEYDFVGMLSLFIACLDNLKSSAVDDELEDLGDYLTEEQKGFLAKLVAYL